MPENMIIQEFGLPMWFPDEEVPPVVVEFCFDIKHTFNPGHPGVSGYRTISERVI